MQGLSNNLPQKIYSATDWIDINEERIHICFDYEHYLQLHRTAMGTHMALSYAKIFIGHLAERLLKHVEYKPYMFGGDVLMIYSLFCHLVKGV